MRYITLLISIFVWWQSIHGQTSNITFTPLANDNAASTFSRKDKSGNVCALIKISSPLNNILIKGDIIGDTYKNGHETWCYISDKEKGIIIVSDSNEVISISFEDHGIPYVVGGKTYSLCINMPNHDSNTAANQNISTSTLPPLHQYTTPKDLAIALQKDDQLYYMTPIEWHDFVNSYGQHGLKRIGIAVLNPHGNGIIALENAAGSQKMYWNTANNYYSLPDKYQAEYICDHKKEINQALRAAGGQELKDWYWKNQMHTQIMHGSYSNEAATCMRGLKTTLITFVNISAYPELSVYIAVRQFCNADAQTAKLI